MSPEELLTTVGLNSSEAFKQMDIYSMALVLWEVISRCEAAGEYSQSIYFLDDLLIDINNILHLARKYTRIFVHEHYLFGLGKPR